ncbi:spermidine synthase [Oceanobacter mangrovi]|uniref:spermidine synthase n=1 Tax=Oceanobacter mangrovi TaxID=2862510 RepID=UPI001C8DF097|nr:spermidine synthase [Oceanobacter mangrovi]
MTASEWFLLNFEIHRRIDELGLIQVFDDGNKRYLSFGTADEQSCMLKQDPLQLQHDYSRAMLASLLMFADQSPAHITMLGLGGGSLPRVMHHLLPEAEIAIVELRKAVADIARQFFYLPRNGRLQIHIEEAGEWLDQAEAGQCQWLMSDLFLADGLDQQQLQQQFIERCYRHLAPGGWLVLNFWREHRDEPLWLWQLKQRFPEVLHATTKDGNWILWAQKPLLEDAAEPLLLSEKTLRQQAKELSTAAKFNLWQAAKPFYRNRQRGPR